MKRIENKLFPYVLIAPAIAIIMMTLILPLIFAIYCSFFNGKAMNLREFVGISHYLNILSSETYRTALFKTIWINGTSLLISVLLGLVFSLWVHRHKGAVAYTIQMMVLIPWVTSQVVGAMLWKWLLHEELGLINYLIESLGGTKVAFLSNKTAAIWVLILVMSWRTVGYAMVNILAGLKGIPQSVEEAALIDGASTWQRLIHIRIPMIKTPILISTIVIALSNINNLTLPLTLTGGGPGTATSVITIPIYRLAFTNLQFGLSSALSVVLFIMTILLALVYVKVVKYEI